MAIENHHWQDLALTGRKFQFNPDALARFAATLGQREFVKDQIDAGVLPKSIEAPKLVELREEHLEKDPRLDKLAQERIIGTNDLLAVNFLPLGMEVARSVCRVRFRDRGIGTGFMVTPTLMITNQHVIQNKQEVAEMSVEFDYELDDHGSMKPSVIFDLDTQGCFISSHQDKLDFTLVTVKPKSRQGNIPLSRYDYIQLVAQTGKILLGEAVNIIQHPNAEPKQLALHNSQLTARLPNHMHYEGDTLPGSSGSPVFNTQWKVICLHHSGVPKTDSAGRLLTRDNQLWDGVNDADIHWIGNEGVRISKIIEDVWRQARSSNQTQFLGDFPEPAPDNPTDNEEVIDVIHHEEKPSKGSSTANAYKVNATAHGVQLTIPLHIQVSLGNPSGPCGCHDQGHPPKHPGSATDTSNDNDNDGTEASLEELARRGKALYQEALRRKYYDEEADSDAKEDYYGSLSSSTSTFKSKLAKLVKDSHSSPKKYDTARIQYLYAWVDLRRNKKVRSIYSHTEYEPNRFIDDDLVIERRRLERINERRLAESFSEDQLESFIDLLEAADPFNAEHVVPQSWFAKKEPMRGDLHHLFSCESGCNSFRNNHQYRDFGKFSITNEATRPNCGFQQQSFFEPFVGKAKVARATLYFALRYPDQFNVTGQAYDSNGIKMLLKWHEAIAPDEHEKHRNLAIQEIQGNRNPFIDHPDWARIFFS